MVQTGSGVRLLNCSLKRGDIILFNHLLATPVGILKDHVLIEYEDILAILTPEEVEDAGA